MASDPSKAALSPARRQLIELMQTINFGRLEELVVCGRQPVFSPPPRVVQEIKFGNDCGPRPERKIADFALKAQVVELFQQLDRLGDGTIESLEVKNGLPLLMRVVRSAC
jgi:hypothetical protein